MEQATGASLTVEVTFAFIKLFLPPCVQQDGSRQLLRRGVDDWKRLPTTEKDHLCFEEIRIVALISIAFAGLGLRQEQRR